MSDDQYIWIVRWGDFQHYEPRRDRGPAWIKTHVDQLNDARYLGLTDRQRALLHDLRMMFSTFRAQLPHNRSMIAAQRNVTTYHADLETLNHVGFIQTVSRETLDRNLEELYASRARARARENEVLRTSSKKALESRNNSSGSSAKKKPVCPECGVGAGLHVIDCSCAVKA